MSYIAIAAIGYLLGCIPSGLLIGRYFYGIDIREYGSKNFGATNMFRTLGPMSGLAVLLADMAKAVAAVLIAGMIAGGDGASLLGGIMAIFGHNYPVFLGFRGGRGVAAGLGVILVLMPEVTAIVFAVWAAIVFFTRYVSLASVIAAVLVPCLAFFFDYSWQFVLFSLAAAIFVVARHRENLKRLREGRESKIKPGNAETVRGLK